MTPNPTFSIVIPTRDRPETLLYAMQSVLCQDGDDFEVIVSDNVSGPGTEEVVRSFNDPRIRYINTGKRLSMCDNWDFAYGHTRGDYVCFIGDDDALMPRALEICRRVIADRRPDMIYGPTHHYLWPVPGLDADILWDPVHTAGYPLDLAWLVNRTFRLGGAGYDRLPCAYRAMIARSVYEGVRTTSGRVFHSMAPDVFTCFAFPAFAQTAYNVGEPIAVCGQSKRRKLSDTQANSGHSREAWAKRWADEFGDYRIHSELSAELSHGDNVIADSALVAKDLFPSYYQSKSFNLAAYYGWFLSFSVVERPVRLVEFPAFASKIRARPARALAILVWWSLFRTYHLYSWVRLRKSRATPRYAELPTNVAAFARRMDEIGRSKPI